MKLSNTGFNVLELGDPQLKVIAKPVTQADWGAAMKVAGVMLTMMEERGGIGIAAPQIGVALQIMIIACQPNERYPNAPKMAPLVLINPKPVRYGATEVMLWEGCLSVPGLRGRVMRPETVEVSYTAESGELSRCSLDGFPARVFQHEYDHLIGKTFLDRVASVADLVSEKVYKQQVLSV